MENEDGDGYEEEITAALQQLPAQKHPFERTQKRAKKNLAPGSLLDEFADGAIGQSI